MEGADNGFGLDAAAVVCVRGRTRMAKNTDAVMGGTNIKHCFACIHKVTLYPIVSLQTCILQLTMASPAA